MPPERSPLEDGDFMNSPAFLFFFLSFFLFSFVLLLLLLFNLLVFCVIILSFLYPGDLHIVFQDLFGCVDSRK